MVAKLPILPHMADHNGPKWYFSRKEIEENAPSRRDGIDLKNETRLRKSYCTILQDLGMQLKVPQLTIATAIVFCHRFFIHQSHAKNDAKTIAAVCMFLAGKAEETPRPLKDVIFVSYGIIHKRNPAALRRFKHKDTFKEVYDQQKELFLLGERVVLTTLGFDLNVLNPYKPLINAIRKFEVANALVQVAWNFVNDGLRTSLWLQFKPCHLAAGAIFLAARFLKVKLPTEGERVWWQEFDVTPRQLEDISNQMLELYEQNSTRKSSHANEGGTGGRTKHITATTSTISENSIAENTTQDVGVVSVQSHDNGSADTKSVVWDHNIDIEGKDCSVNDAELVSYRRANTADSLSCSNSSIEQPVGGAVMNDKGKTREGLCEPLNRQRPENQCSGQPGTKDLENAEEMKSSCIDGHEFPSLEVCAVSIGGQLEGKRLHDFPHPTWGSTGAGRLDHPERDHKRHRTERQYLH